MNYEEQLSNFASLFIYLFIYLIISKAFHRGHGKDEESWHRTLVFKKDGKIKDICILVAQGHLIMKQLVVCPRDTPEMVSIYLVCSWEESYTAYITNLQ